MRFLVLLGFLVFSFWLAWQHKTISQYPVLWGGSLALLFVGGLYMASGIIYRHIPGEVVIHRHKKAMSPTTILFAVGYTVFYGMGKYRLSLVSIFWVWLAIDVVQFFWIKKRKPIGLVVAGDTLFINEIWVTKRTISALKKIQLAGMSANRIKFSFDKESALQLRIDEYNPSDLLHMIDVLQQRSSHTVEVAPEVQRRLM